MENKWTARYIRCFQNEAETKGQTHRGEDKTQHSIQRANICLTGVPERQQKDNGMQAICEEIMAEIFPELMETSIWWKHQSDGNINLQNQESLKSHSG